MTELEVTPELVRQLLDDAELTGNGEAVRDLAENIAIAYLQVCEERDQAEAKIAAGLWLADSWMRDAEEYSQALRAGEPRLIAHQHQLLITGRQHAEILRATLGGSDV